MAKYNPVLMEKYKEMYPKISEMFPKVFDKTYPKPLEIGSHIFLSNRTNFSELEITDFLLVWTRRCEYIGSLIGCKNRFKCDGELGSEIIHWHKKKAFKLLKSFRRPATKESALRSLTYYCHEDNEVYLEKYRNKKLFTKKKSKKRKLYAQKA